MVAELDNGLAVCVEGLGSGADSEIEDSMEHCPRLLPFSWGRLRKRCYPIQATGSAAPYQKVKKLLREEDGDDGCNCSPNRVPPGPGRRVHIRRRSWRLRISRLRLAILSPLATLKRLKDGYVRLHYRVSGKRRKVTPRSVSSSRLANERRKFPPPLYRFEIVIKERTG